MADENSTQKRDISSTPAKSSDNKRPRFDLNSSLQNITGMDIDDKSEVGTADIDIDAIVDKALGKYATMSNSAAKHAGTKQRGVTTTMNTEELFAKLLSGVATAIKETTKAVITMVKETEEKKYKKQIDVMENRMQQLALLAKYDNDKMEQYSRRESVRISGISETVEHEEALNTEIVQIAEEINVDIKPGDISVAHRVCKRGDRLRPVLVKFVSRQTRDSLMKGRKKLKDLEKHKGKTYINEDLIRLRARLFGFVKSLDSIDRCNTSNGVIHCNLKDGKYTTVETPDDLFKLGMSQEDIDYKRFGLEQYTN